MPWRRDSGATHSETMCRSSTGDPGSCSIVHDARGRCPSSSTAIQVVTGPQAHAPVRLDEPFLAGQRRPEDLGVLAQRAQPDVPDESPVVLRHPLDQHQAQDASRRRRRRVRARRVPSDASVVSRRGRRDPAPTRAASAISSSGRGGTVSSYSSSGTSCARRDCVTVVSFRRRPRYGARRCGALGAQRSMPSPASSAIGLARAAEPAEQGRSPARCPMALSRASWITTSRLGLHAADVVDDLAELQPRPADRRAAARRPGRPAGSTYASPGCSTPATR